MVVLIAVFMVAVSATAAGAQTDEEAAAIAALDEALTGVECVTVEGCIEEVAEVKAAVAALKALFADLDYGALDAAIADLEAAIEGGDLDAISAAAEAVAAAGGAVADAATAAAAAGDGGDTTTTTAATAAPTAVATGGPIDSGPNVALLGLAALLVLLAGGALVLRLTADRR
jgi:hypothetical protein